MNGSEILLILKKMKNFKKRFGGNTNCLYICTHKNDREVL